MGLDLNDLTKRYPRLVVGHANGFGSRGPDADKAMLDGAAQARGGLVSLSGPKDDTPMPPGATIADTAGAMLLGLELRRHRPRLPTCQEGEETGLRRLQMSALTVL